MKKKIMILQLATMLLLSSCGNSKPATADTDTPYVSASDSASNELSVNNSKIEEEKGASDNSDAASEEKVDTVITEDEQQKESQTNESTESEQKDEDPLGFNVMFSKTYRNDATGNWRLARIAEYINIEEYALDYYKNYFEADNEIHVIINFTLNTTTRITVMGNLLDVTIMEYVDKEEHDAALACSGTLLNEYHVNMDTGEIETIQ